MLNNRFVRTVIISNLLLQLGIWVRNFAILLYVTELTDNNPFYVSLISVAEYAPIFIFAVIGGTFADRWRPKRTMVWCDLLSAASLLLVIVALGSGSWHILIIATLVSAILSQFSQPSVLKLFKYNVPAEQLQGIMAMFQSLMAFFMVIGPMIGTYVYQHYGIGVSLAVTVALFFGSAVVLSLLPRDPDEPVKKEKPDFKRELKEGLHYVWSNRALRTLGGTFAAAGLAVGLIQPLMLFVTIENLGQDKQFLQWLLTANGAAMLVGGGLIMGIAKKVSPQALLAFGLVISTLGTIGIGWSENIPLTIALQALNGLFYPCIHIGIQTLMMKNTEAAFVGRVGGTLTPLFMGMMVVGMFVSGTLKDVLTLPVVFTAAAGLFLISALILVPLLQRKHRTGVPLTDPSVERAGSVRDL